MIYKYKILAVEWRSALHVIGFVAYQTHDQWNSVVGYNPFGGFDKDFDIQYIAGNGAKIEWNVARELFPQLDIRKHKYYPTIKK